MPELMLFHCPGACSRVTLTALEHVGVQYQATAVNLFEGEQLKAQFRAVNPRGKVPALLIDGQLLTENLAIIFWLDSTFPEAGLLPSASDPLQRAKQVADLSWMSSTWHPYVRANTMPMRFTVGDPEPVRERGKLLITPCMDQIDAQFGQNSWWFGEQWSIADVYLYWCYTTAEKGEFSLAKYRNIQKHREAVDALPAFQRALKRESTSL